MARRRTGNIQDRGTSWRIRYTGADGVRHTESYPTREEAEGQLAIRLGEMASGLPVSSGPHTVTFIELAADVITDYEINKYKSISDQKARFRLHLNPAFGARRASQIATSQIRRYIAWRQGQQASTGTINRELELLRRTFRLAIEDRKLLHMPHVPILREDNVRTGFFTREDVDRLCSFLPGRLASMVRFGFLTGWRYAEIRRLQWRDIDFGANEIRIDPGRTKNRDGRVFPMTAELRSLLEAVRTTHVTVNRKTSQTVESHQVAAMTVFPGGSFRKRWKTACYQAGLPCVVEPITIRGKLQKRVKVVRALRTFHDLRRSFAREMSNRGVREGAIMRLAGWKTRSVFDRYNIVSDADLRDAVERIDAKHHKSPRRKEQA